MTENNTNIQTAASTQTLNPNQYAVQDLKNSVLIVSIVVNLGIVITWIALQLTTQYDSQLANFFFSR